MVRLLSTLSIAMLLLVVQGHAQSQAQAAAPAAKGSARQSASKPSTIVNVNTATAAERTNSRLTLRWRP